eukprot:SAG31_NODE_36806_length_310_cov_0.725118_1_plen_47_part_01
MNLALLRRGCRAPISARGGGVAATGLLSSAVRRKSTAIEKLEATPDG